ncbi:MAG: hypothetical protein K9I85_05185 [Saprospiraceae bacterium]|nr:hypothetical protein [Saprospiraceae bacterium]
MSILVLTLGLSCLSLKVGAQFLKPHVYVGASVGGGLSIIVNQNNYGFPEMNYNPAIATQYGVHAGLAMRPWSRLQVDYQIYRSSYRFSESYSSSSTDGILSLRKQIDITLVNIPLTYRHYIINPDLIYAGNEKSISIALQRKNTFFVLVGPQISSFKRASVTFQKNSAATGFKWQAADLIDIKPGFDGYVPIDEIPDHLPEDSRDLFQKTFLCLVGGVGWNLILSPGLEITLEAQAFFSLLDINSSDRDLQNRYLWRRRVYSASDPDPYYPASLQVLTLNAGIHYTF